MPHVRPSERPAKLCAACGRPFTWRKRWRDCWDEVRYCSKACRGRRPRNELSDPNERA